MIRKIIINLLLIFATAQLSLGQQGETGIYVDSLGQVYVQANKPVYFFIAPESKQESKILIPSKDSKSNPMYFDGNGTHYLRTQDAETNKPVRFKIYADGIAPKVKLQFKHRILINSSKRLYVEEGSKADIIAKDNLSGVRNVFVSIDDSEFTFSKTVTFDKGNDFLLKTFAVDNVGNISDTLQFRVITALDSIVKINKIYFDNNSSMLRPESKTELNELVQVLNEYAEIKIELRAHTDSRGDDEYNLHLSERRAEAIVNYLIRNGVSKTRLSYKGFGSSCPLNECVKGVACSDDKHQKNRRVEFKILPIK